MAKNNITQYDATAANNTDIQSVDIDEGCAPSGINNAIRELMADLKDMDTGAVALTSPDFTSFKIGGTTVTASAADLNSAGGGLSGPASTTNHEIAVFNGTSGDAVEGSGAVLEVAGSISHKMIQVPEGEETGGSYRVLYGASNFNTSAATSNNHIISFGHSIVEGWNTVGAFNGGAVFVGKDLCQVSTTNNPTLTRMPCVNVGTQNIYASGTLPASTAVDMRETVVIGNDNIRAQGAFPASITAYGCKIIGDGNLPSLATGTIDCEYDVVIGETNLGPKSNSTGTFTSSYNVVLGNSNLRGYFASDHNMTANRNIAIGENVLDGTNQSSASTVENNVCIGRSAATDNGGGTTSNNIAIGYNAGNSTSPSGNITGSSNKIVLGNNSITNAYIRVSWTVTSDERDKADKTNFNLGLDQINQINPISFKWDMRSDYYEFDDDGQVTEKPTPDGTHKKDQPYLGFSAQELKTIFDAAGAPSKTIVDDTDAENLKLKESALLPVMVNAIKQLSAKCDSLQAQIDAMGA